MWSAIAGTTCTEDSLRAKSICQIMPPQDDEALPDAVVPAAGRDDCESALLVTEATSNNSQSQQDAVPPVVGAVASTANNAGEDGDITIITAESRTHADDHIATTTRTCSGASPPSPGSNFRRGGVAEAEEQNRVADADVRSALSTSSGLDKKYPDEEALNVQVALTACSHDKRGNSNTSCTGGSDDSFTDAAAATAGTRGDASTISSTRGDASTISSIPTSLASASASGGVSSSLSGTTLSSTWTAGVLTSIPDNDEGGDGNGNDGTREDTPDFSEQTATAIRRSIHDTPGAFYVTPINVAGDSHSSAEGQESATGSRTFGSSSSSNNNNSQGNNDVQAGQEQAPTSATPPLLRRHQHQHRPAHSSSGTSVELTEAWVVEEEDSHWVAATPVKERRCIIRSGGILLTIFFVGCVAAVAVAITTKKKTSQSASPSRPFDLEVPSMPRDVSEMLKVKYNKFTENKPSVMMFSADLTVHASTLVDDNWYGQLQVVRYSANSSSWEVVAKYDEDEARAEDQKIGQSENSAGALFGSWADMSYDGRILAVGLPRDDALNVPDAGSVRVMKLETPLEHNGDSQRWDLKGHGNYIAGTDPFGWTGTHFSLSSDGSMIAVASPLASNFRGNVIVYKFGSNDTVANGGEWIQIGQTIIGEETGDAVSFVKLSEDGSMLTVCSFMHDGHSGQVKIYRWDTPTNLWAQMGSAIEGNDKDRLGMFPQFSRDGLTVSVSEYGLDELMRPLNPYKCHVYHWQEQLNSDWVRIDDDLVFPYGYIGMDLSPDGKRVLLCSPNEMRCILNSLHSGKWHEGQEFLVEEHGFLPYLFERDGDGEKLAGIVAPVGKSDGYTIGFYNIN